MARFCSLFSGSSGNCTYISAGDSGILIDAGVSAKRIREALAARDIDPASIRGIFVTHEHSDHIGGVRVLANQYGCPVYASKGTLAGMDKANALPSGQLFALGAGESVAVGDLQITAFATPHDTPESTGYAVETADGTRLAVATDMGELLPAVFDILCGCDVVLLESNHDVKMLRAGPYPPFLQDRILSNRGHLSNAACATALPALVNAGVSQILLGHLSEKNNTPTLAYDTSVTALAEAGITVGRDVRLSVAKRANDEPVSLV